MQLSKLAHYDNSSSYSNDNSRATTTKTTRKTTTPTLTIHLSSLTVAEVCIFVIIGGTVPPSVANKYARDAPTITTLEFRFGVTFIGMVQTCSSLNCNTSHSRHVAIFLQRLLSARGNYSLHNAICIDMHACTLQRGG